LAGIAFVPGNAGFSARVTAAMASRSLRATAVNTPLQKGRKNTQRERLLTGLIIAANRDGYARANVSSVITEAGVSRPTFYDYFADKDDAFVAALNEVADQLLVAVRAGAQGEAPERAMQASIRALVGFASAEPAIARFLVNEPMAGGPAALDARDRCLTAIERVIQQRYQRVDPRTPIPDVSPRMLVGGVFRLLASRLRRGEPSLTALIPDLLSWVDAYGQPLGEHKWRSLRAVPSPPSSPFVPTEPLHGPGMLPPGRIRMSEEDVAENQRQRIMFAAARLAEDKGYTATTIGDITKLARVDGRVFYSMFSDKQEAFMAVHELGFQRVMDVTGGAFFAGATWPERNWEAGRAFTQFLERNPMIAHVGFVEAYAVGPGAVQRLEDSQTAFAMLLQDGYQYVPEDARPPRLALDAIITTIFEVVYHRARSSGKPRLSGLLPHLNFLVLSPFIGPDEANAFIEQKLEASRSK
jgi:AcrR family transcriptional regulator